MHLSAWNFEFPTAVSERVSRALLASPASHRLTHLVLGWRRSNIQHPDVVLSKHSAECVVVSRRLNGSSFFGGADGLGRYHMSDSTDEIRAQTDGPTVCNCAKLCTAFAKTIKPVMEKYRCVGKHKSVHFQAVLLAAHVALGAEPVVRSS